MNRKLLIFNKKQYSTLKQQFIDEGKEIHSITYFLDNKKIEDLDENSVLDISSLAGLLKINDGIQLQFEQLFLFFPENMTFIVEDKFKEDAEFYFRYCFTAVEVCDIGVENDETKVNDSREVEEIKHNVKKIVDLSEEEIKNLLKCFQINFMDIQNSRMNLLILYHRLGYLIK